MAKQNQKKVIKDTESNITEDKTVLAGNKNHKILNETPEQPFIADTEDTSDEFVNENIKKPKIKSTFIESKIAPVFKHQQEHDGGIRL